MAQDIFTRHSVIDETRSAETMVLEGTSYMRAASGSPELPGQSEVLELGAKREDGNAENAGNPGGRKTLASALNRIDDLESNQLRLKEENESELNKLRVWYRQLEVKWQEEKARADQESANSQAVLAEKHNLQDQINELQNAAGNMASTADRVHKWLEERTHTLKKCWEQEKSRADRNATSVQSLTVEKQELVQQLNELHAAADNMVTGAAESVHQLVEEKTKETLREAAQEKARAEAEAARNAILAREKELLLEQLQEMQKQATVPEQAPVATPRLAAGREKGVREKGKPVDPMRAEVKVSSPVAESPPSRLQSSSASVKRTSALETTPVFGQLSGVLPPQDGVAPAMSHMQVGQVSGAQVPTLSSARQRQSSSGAPRWAYRADATTPPIYGYAAGAPVSAKPVANGVMNPMAQSASALPQQVPQPQQPVTQLGQPVQHPYLNTNVRRQTSPAVAVRRETTPVQTPRVRATVGVRRESSPLVSQVGEVRERQATPILVERKVSPSHSPSPIIARQSTPQRQVERQVSPFPVIRQTSPFMQARQENSAVRCVSEPSKQRMRSFEMERSFSSSRREKGEFLERNRSGRSMMEQSVSVTTLESIAQAAAEAQLQQQLQQQQQHQQQQQQQQQLQSNVTVPSASTPRMNGAQSLAGSVASLPGQPMVLSYLSTGMSAGIPTPQMSSAPQYAYAPQSPVFVQAPSDSFAPAPNAMQIPVFPTQQPPNAVVRGVSPPRLMAVRQVSPGPADVYSTRMTTTECYPATMTKTPSPGPVRALSPYSSSPKLLAASDSRGSSVFRSASNPVVSRIWSSEQSSECGNQSLETLRSLGIQVLSTRDAGSILSVGQAVDALNSGAFKVDRGIAAVYSASKDSYWLLWRSDVDAATLVTCGSRLGIAVKKDEVSSLPSTPLGSRSSSLASNRVQRAKRSESAQLPRLTSGVPWQPSDDNVVIATLEAFQPNSPGRFVGGYDPLSASARSFTESVQSGVTCLEGASVSTAMGGTRDSPPRQPVFQDPNMFAAVAGSLRSGGLRSPRSPYKQSPPVANVMQPRVVPLISRLPTGGKAPAAPAQEFAVGMEGFLTERSDSFPNYSPALDARGHLSGVSSLSDRGSYVWAGSKATLPANLIAPMPMGQMLDGLGGSMSLGGSMTAPLDLKSKSLTLPVGAQSTYPGFVQNQFVETIATDPTLGTPRVILQATPSAAVRQSSVTENGRGRSPARLPTTPRGGISRAEYIEFAPRTARPTTTFTQQPVMPGLRMGLCTSVL